MAQRTAPSETADGTRQVFSNKNTAAAVEELIDLFRSASNERDRAGMARFGINTERAFGGTTLPTLRQLGRRIGKNHPLALALWESGWHEARILASIVDDPAQLTLSQMDSWTAGFDSWDICDQVCSNLFRYSPHAWERIGHYAADEREFVRRTAFALLAELAVGDKTAEDQRFETYFPLIEQYATDPRNFVRKAVNWALRQIGKRNQRLHPQALELAQKLCLSNHKTARWIGSDAVRELSSEKIIARIKP